MSTATVLFKDRNTLGASIDVSIDDFIGLFIDYRTEGNMAQQHNTMQSDFEHVMEKARKTGQQTAVISAFRHYLKLITQGYGDVAQAT